VPASSGSTKIALRRSAHRNQRSQHETPPISPSDRVTAKKPTVSVSTSPSGIAFTTSIRLRMLLFHEQKFESTVVFDATHAFGR